MKRNQKFQIGAKEKELILAILKKIKKERNKRPNKISIISFNDFFGLLTEEEIKLIKVFIGTKPSRYGFKSKYLGIKNMPKNLVAIRGQKLIKKNGRGSSHIPTRYLPKPVLKTYRALNLCLKKETGRKLLINSGYRSPAYQMIIFLEYLVFHNFNFLKVIKALAIPGYSEHGSPFKQALDFITTDGVPSDESSLSFTETQEYKWLKKNAQKFNFYESYPKDNKLGVIFEPWHWRFEK